MAIGHLLFAMGWNPSTGVTYVGFHHYLRRNRKDMVCFADSVCGGFCASNSRQKTIGLRG